MIGPLLGKVQAFVIKPDVYASAVDTLMSGAVGAYRR
jgi:hypothetical protein